MNQTILVQLASVAGVLLGGGVGVSIVAQVVKKVFGLKSKGVIHFFVIAMAFAAAAFQYVMSLKNLPLDVLGVSAPAIYGFSQGAYIFVEKASNFLGRVDVTVEKPQTVVAPTTIATNSSTSVPVTVPATTPVEPPAANF